MTDQLMRRPDAAAYVRGRGFPCTEATLAKYACRGGGPAMVCFGTRRVFYTRADLDAWIASRTRVRGISQENAA